MTKIQQLRRKYGHHKLAVDYLRARELARQEMTTIGGWSMLSDTDKYEIIILFLEDDTLTTIQNDTNKVGFLMGKGLSYDESKAYLIKSYSDHNIKEVEACSKRANSSDIRQVLISHLSINDAADFTRTIEKLISLYANRGIKGTEDGTSGEGIFNFIESTLNTSYATAGLKEQGYTLLKDDYPTFITKVMDVLRNGNYKR